MSYRGFCSMFSSSTTWSLRNIPVKVRAFLHPSHLPDSSLGDSLLHPLVEHTSQHSETHYYPLRSSREILLHSHSTGPYIAPIDPGSGMRFTIYSHACEVKEVTLRVDWVSSLGCVPSRYAMTMISWIIGVIATMSFLVWKGDGQSFSVDI